MNRQLTLVRHAPVTPSGILFGQTDADITPPSKAEINALHYHLAECDALYSSPAQRCIKTCSAVFPDKPSPALVDAFWEQSFGTWEGKPYTELPDIGTLEGEALVTFRPPEGESFADICDRVVPSLQSIISQTEDKHIVIFAHAGVIRAVLSYALDNRQAALKFEIDTVSATKFRILPDGKLTVISSNIKR